MRIAYLGDTRPASTAYQRSLALERLGHRVERFDPWLAFQGRRPGRLAYHSGYRWLQKPYQRALRDWFERQRDADQQAQHDWNLVWVDSGEWFAAATVTALKARSGAPLLLYHVDDGTARRDQRRFASLRNALPVYDLCVTVRFSTELEMRALGARRTLRVWMSHDELVHGTGEPLPPQPLGGDPSLAAQIAFIGTRIPGEGRDTLLRGLQKAGLPLALWGSRWTTSRHWWHLRRSYRGDFIAGADLRAAMSLPAACLGLLSHGNRDLHTTRSFEIPAAGGLLCAQRTSEHALLYDDGEEAALWGDADECLQSCRRILADPAAAACIRRAGRERLHRHGIGNEDICRQILAHLEAI